MAVKLNNLPSGNEVLELHHICLWTLFLDLCLQLVNVLASHFQDIQLVQVVGTLHQRNKLMQRLVGLYSASLFNGGMQYFAVGAVAIGGHLI